VTRVAFVSPEPTPYRSPLFDRVGATEEIDLTVIYAAHTVAGRTWKVELLHRAVFLDGFKVPGLRGVFRHDYPVTPGIWRALREAKPECVVVSGWSTFAAQAAIVWCRVRRVPYVLLVESHDSGPKPGWRRRVKQNVVPPIVKGAASVLVVGSLARESVLALGAPPGSVRVFANTIDVARYGERADRLAGRRAELRNGLGASADDVAVVSVARLAPEKGLDSLLRAVAKVGDERLIAIVVGEGPEHARLEQLARELGVRATLAGGRPWESVIEAYAASDVFALLSEREPWGVVVNEAAACGLPLVLSDRVGAARDLLRDGENGMLVAAGDAEAAADAFRRLAADRDLRLRMGARSRSLAEGFGYGPSVENLLEAVREATASR
jgi:glycosyltransferase involved in cell wall biosynthesis